MRRLTKKLCAAVLLLALAGSAFAEMGMYLKGGLGYTHRAMDFGLSGGNDYVNVNVDGAVPMNLFGITPAFGIEPFLDNGNAFLRGLAFEFSLDLAFGSGDTVSVTIPNQGSPEGELADSLSGFAITPGVTAVYSHRFEGGLKPFGGAGFSVPIQRVSGIDDVLGGGGGLYENSSVKVGFNVNLMAGLAYEVTEKLAPYVELGIGFGSSFAFNARAGVQYRLGGGSSGGASASDGAESGGESEPASEPAEEAGA